ncbi:MAG: hypothetical protein ACPGVZ_03105 [Myxococcota bacterium]
MTRASAVFVLFALVALAGSGCTRKYTASPSEVRANHDREWTIESMPGEAERTEAPAASE